MSELYPLTKAKMMQGLTDMNTGVVRAVLVDTGVYTYSAAHEFYSDLSGVVGTESPAFTSKTFSATSVFDAADIQFAAVTGNTVEALVIFLDTGNAATDQLIAYIDSATGLPVTPDGGPIDIAWHANGIFQL